MTSELAKPKYVVITPVRDEAGFLRLLVGSMVAQTARPARWVIVDDGSSDDTATVALDAEQRYEWISVVRRPDRGSRLPGRGVIQAFSAGYDLVKNDDWEFVVKLDGDLSFESGYFEECFRRFSENSKLGIGGGTVCRVVDDYLVPEAPDDPRFHVRGATKIYKRGCWNAIGGLIEAPGWDTVDEYKANMLGWATYTFPDLKVRHHRHAGGAHGTWNNWVKNGLANYIAGYHPLFMACKCAKRLTHQPYLVAAAGLMTGFVSGYINRVPQVADSDLIHYVRRQQLRRLCFRDSLWDVAPRVDHGSTATRPLATSRA